MIFSALRNGESITGLKPHAALFRFNTVDQGACAAWMRTLPFASDPPVTRSNRRGIVGAGDAPFAAHGRHRRIAGLRPRQSDVFPRHPAFRPWRSEAGIWGYGGNRRLLSLPAVAISASRASARLKPVPPAGPNFFRRAGPCLDRACRHPFCGRSRCQNPSSRSIRRPANASRKTPSTTSSPCIGSG